MDKIKLFAFLLVLSFVVSCKKEKTEPEYTHLMFPIGKAHMGQNEVSLKINDQMVEPNIVEDDFGGFWIQVPVGDLAKPSEIKVTYLRKAQELTLYRESKTNVEAYLQPVNFIDCNSETLKNKAVEICTGLTTNIEKADKIARFVANYLTLTIYKDAFLDNASKTYELGYGICINHARLTTAICRAAGVPARTVWGIIRNPENGVYDYHHEWTEILDNEGYWHPLDNTNDYRFNLNDIMYLDLYYAPEQNTFIQENAGYNFILGDVSYFDGYPAPLSGRLNMFNITDNSMPDAVKVELTYVFGE